MDRGFVLRLDNKNPLRIWQKLNLFLHWHLGWFFFLACLWANTMTKTPYIETRFKWTMRFALFSIICIFKSGKGWRRWCWERDFWGRVDISNAVFHSFHLSLSSDCCFGQNKIFLQLFDKCFSFVISGNALQNLALWKDRTPFHTTPSKNMREKYFFFLSFIFSFSGNAALYGKCILSYHLLPLLANCTGPPAPQFVISRR